MRASFGGFFDVDPPEPGPEPEVPPMPGWLQPPQDELPGRVVIDEVVFRDSGSVLLLRELRQHGNGIDVRLRWFGRRGDRSARDWDAVVRDTMGWHGPGGNDDELRVGAVLADGTRLLPVHLVTAVRGSEELMPPTLHLQHQGGGGGLDGYRGDFSAWIWAPHDEVGHELDLVLRWDAMGIPETRHRITAEVFAAAPAPRPLWD